MCQEFKPNEVELVWIEIPGELYASRIVNLVGALLAIDEKMFPNESGAIDLDRPERGAA